MLHFYKWYDREYESATVCINALSGWGSISTGFSTTEVLKTGAYQCPLGLVLHFYAVNSMGELKYRLSINALSG